MNNGLDLERVAVGVMRVHRLIGAMPGANVGDLLLIGCGKPTEGQLVAVGYPEAGEFRIEAYAGQDNVKGVIAGIVFGNRT